MKAHLKIFAFAFLLLGLSSIGMSQAKRADRCHPHAEINGYKGAAIVKAKQLSTLKSLEVINDCKDGRSYTIMSFNLITVINKKKMNYAGSHGDLTPEMKKALAKCKAGANVVFSNIQVKSGDGKMESVQGVTLHVK
jgi:hypothetical protein